MAVVTNMSYPPPFQFQKAKKWARDMSSFFYMLKTFFWFSFSNTGIQILGCQSVTKKGKDYPIITIPSWCTLYMEEEEKDFARLRTQIKELLRACQISNNNERKSTMFLSM